MKSLYFEFEISDVQKRKYLSILAHEFDYFLRFLSEIMNTNWSACESERRKVITSK